LKLKGAVKKVAAGLEVPADILVSELRITLYGSYRVVVENHSGVMDYSTTRIRLRAGDGQVHITGSGLRFAMVDAAAAAIEGCITGISRGGSGYE